MKSNSIIKWGGIIIATVALATGIWSVNQETEEITIPQVVKIVDTEDGSVIVEEEEVPLASTPTVKVKTTTKKTVKKNKLKKKATKTKTTTKRTTTKKTTTTESSSKKVKTETTINSTVQSKTKKKSNVETVTTTIKTTVKTTTTNKPKTTTATTSTTTASASSSSSTSASSSASSKVTTIVMRNLATAADSNVLQAYEIMGFETEINPSKTYTGYFSAIDRKITMQEKSASTAYHELGHFVAWLAGNVDTKSEFVTIYNSEKSKVTVPNKIYLTKNSSEYFAESYREYVMDPSSLQKNRPQTYEYVKNAVAKITAARAKAIKTSYEATYWK